MDGLLILILDAAELDTELDSGWQNGVVPKGSKFVRADDILLLFLRKYEIYWLYMVDYFVVVAIIQTPIVYR